MKGFFVLVAALAITLPSVSYAEPEAWYTYWALGSADHDHPGDVEQIFSEAERFRGFDRTELSLDMFGFYWPLETNDMIGFIVNGTSDNLTNPFLQSVSLNTYLYALSYMRFTGTEPGDGFFVRGDFGLAKAAVIVDGPGFSDTLVSESGHGYLVGIGYAIPLSSQTRIMFGANYTDRQIENDSFKSTQFTIGFLW